MRYGKAFNFSQLRLTAQPHCVLFWTFNDKAATFTQSAHFLPSQSRCVGSKLRRNLGIIWPSWKLPNQRVQYHLYPRPAKTVQAQRFGVSDNQTIQMQAIGRQNIRPRQMKWAQCSPIHRCLRLVRECLCQQTGRRFNGVDKDRQVIVPSYYQTMMHMTYGSKGRLRLSNRESSSSLSKESLPKNYQELLRKPRVHKMCR